MLNLTNLGPVARRIANTLINAERWPNAEAGIKIHQQTAQALRNRGIANGTKVAKHIRASAEWMAYAIERAEVAAYAEAKQRNAADKLRAQRNAEPVANLAASLGIGRTFAKQANEQANEQIKAWHRTHVAAGRDSNILGGWAPMIEADEAEAYLDERQIGPTHPFSLDYLATEGFNGALTPSFATWAAAAITHRWFSEIVVEAGPGAYGETTFIAWDGPITDADGCATVGGRWHRYYFWSPMAREDALDEVHAKARVLNMFLDFMGAFVPNPVPGSRVDEADQFVMWTRRNHTIGAGTEAWYVAFLADEATAHEMNPHRGRCMWDDNLATAVGVGDYGQPRGPLCSRHVRPAKTITDRDIEWQARRALDGSADEFDVKAIVREFIHRFGLVDVDSIADADWTELVQRYDLAAAADYEAAHEG